MAGKKVIHMAPQARRVPLLMRNLLQWLGSTDTHPLIASCVFHYEFEFIHPCSDGNGRLGRLWQTLILTRWRPLFADLPVESLVYAQQRAYYQAIRTSTQQRDAAPFVEFMLRRVLDAIQAFTPQVTPKDVDFLGFGPDDLPRMASIFRDICAVTVEDGIVFDSASVSASEIRIDANYGGVRVNLMGVLDNARCPIQAGIGFGDAVTLEPEDATYPTVLANLPAPRLRVYSRYTVVAEKFHAIVEHGILNSRLKDFFDLWVLTTRAEFDLNILARAITATFDRRGTPLPATTPVGLSDEFATDKMKQTQWRGFVSKGRINAPPLSEINPHLRIFFSNIPFNHRTKISTKS